MHVIARVAGATGALGAATMLPLWASSAARGTSAEMPARVGGVSISAALGAAGAALVVPRGLPTIARVGLIGVGAAGAAIAGARLGATQPSKHGLEPWPVGNGCGEGAWNGLVPDFGFEEACDEHDRYYLRRARRDGSPATRKEADGTMLEDGVAQVEERFAAGSPRRYLGLAAASTYYGVIRTFGEPWWGAPPEE